MIEIIWRLRATVLTDEAELRALISAVVELPGMRAAQYDLNRKGQWRQFDLTHTVVDALTQRTQLLVIRGPGDREDASSAHAMIALGKHGEQPTVIIRLPEAPGVAAQVMGEWGELYDAIELESTFLMSTARRATMSQAGIDAPAIGGALAMAWHPARIPAGLRDLDRARFADTPIALSTHATHWLIDFGQAPMAPHDIAEGSAYRGALRALNACLIDG